MKVRHNTALEIAVPLDKYGEPGSVTRVTAEVLDGDESVIELLGEGTIDPAENVATFTIPNFANLVRAGETIDARSVALTIRVDGVDQTDAIYYSVHRLGRLVPPQNSFITMTAAHASMKQMLDTAGWDSADEDRRAAALEQAYYRLIAIPYQVQRSLLPEDLALEIINSQSGRFDSSVNLVILPEDWEYLSADDFALLPKRFQAALRMAQMTEAEEMLRGDTIEEKLKYGVISESIGESSIRLNTRRLITGVSADTLQHLRGFIYFDHRIVR